MLEGARFLFNDLFNAISFCSQTNCSKEFQKEILKVTFSLCISKKQAMEMYAVCVQTTSPTMYYAKLNQICQLFICYKNYIIIEL